MKNCQQNETQTIYDHGESVRDHLETILNYVHNNVELDETWKVPEWLSKYKNEIATKLLPTETVLEYALFHDVGKPQCLVIEDGKRHFPDHANVSYNYWIDNGGDIQVANLIKQDMDVHLLKDAGVDEFITRPECFTLLLSGLAEVHANANMFGGIDSTSFKIKWKQLKKRGNAICNKVFSGS